MLDEDELVTTDAEDDDVMMMMMMTMWWKLGWITCAWASPWMAQILIRSMEGKDTTSH